MSRSGFYPFDEPRFEVQRIEVVEQEREPSRPLLYDATGRPLMSPRPSRIAGFRHSEPGQHADHK